LVFTPIPLLPGLMVMAAGTCDGQGVCNNVTLPDWPSEFRHNSFVPTASVLGQSSGNIGLLMRQRYTVYDPCADITPEGQTPASAHTKNLLPIGCFKEYVAKSYYRASWGWE
jgi:hypothetical protein